MTTRTRTHSALKWLANERAALAGEIERFDRRIAHLGALRDKVGAELAEAEHRVCRLETRRESASRTLDSRDSAIGHCDPRLDPTQIRAVDAQGRRGSHGALKKAVLEELAIAGAEGRHWYAFAILLVDRFGLAVDGPELWSWWHDMPDAALRRLRSEGKVQSTGDANSGLTWYLTSATNP